MGHAAIQPHSKRYLTRQSDKQKIAQHPYFKDYYIDPKTGTPYDRRFAGYQHHHIVERKDLVDLKFVSGAEVSPLAGDAHLFNISAKVRKDAHEIYQELPCVTIPFDYHGSDFGSLTGIYRYEAGHISPNALAKTYFDAHKLLFDEGKAKELNRAVEAILEFVTKHSAR